jgi:hypothetical protein
MSGGKDGDREDSESQGRSAEEPAEGGDHKRPPDEGSPDTGGSD